MYRPPPASTSYATCFPFTTLFRSAHFLELRMVDVKNAGAAFGCSSVSLPSDRLGRYLHLVLFENSQDLFGPNFPELADLDDACLALFRDTLGGCRELDDEHFQAIEDLQRIDRKSNRLNSSHYCA